MGRQGFDQERALRRGVVGAFASLRGVAKGVIAALGVAGAIAFAPVVASANGLTAIHLDCGDGFPMDAVVDLQTLGDLQDFVNNTVNFPAGVTCLLSTSLVTDPLATPSTDPIFFGSGRYAAPAQADTQNPSGSGMCMYNFAVHARMRNGVTEGTSNVTETKQTPATTPNQPCLSDGGHLDATLVCLNVNTMTNLLNPAATAEASGPIKHATGDFAFLAPTATSVNGHVVHGSAGTPDSNPPGTISHVNNFGAPPPCSAKSGAFNLTNGKVTIKSN